MVGYTPGDRVLWTTQDAKATVLEVKDCGDIVIEVDGSPVPITTRAVFLEKTKDQLPTSGYLPGKGRVRVLSYEGNGMFFVLTNRDERVLVHRDRLKFTRRGRA